MRSPATSPFLAALCALALWSGTARADEASDVNQLFHTGKTTEALARADQVIAAAPNNAQMRFLKGVMLTDLKRFPEAIDVFNRLTQDYPELPEPFNNLAAVYAAQGQYQDARVALETAVRNNPGYATANENLGDVYAKLASQAYARSVALDSHNLSAASKLEIIRKSFKPATAPAPEITDVPLAAPAAEPAAPANPAATTP
jgi:Flp pilus assembly protein TadD